MIQRTKIKKTTTIGQEFTDNLEDTQVPALANTSHDSDSERPTKVASRKHSVYTHFSQNRNCDVCTLNKITIAPCRRRTGEAVPRADKFGDLITANHKVLNEGGESRKNHRYAVVQDLAIRWIQSYPCKTKTCQETERSSRKFLVKTHHGITALQHLIDPRQMATLKEPFDEQRKVRQQYCYNQDWMKGGGLIL